MHTTQAKSLLFILFIATAGCFNAQKSHDHDHHHHGAHDETHPQISEVSTNSLSVIAGQGLTLTVSTTNATLGEDVMYHVYLNDTDTSPVGMGMQETSSVLIPLDTPAGTYKLIVRLHDMADHKALQPEVKSSVEIKIQQAPMAWFFSSDSATNSWNISLVAPAERPQLITELQVDSLSLLSGDDSDGGNGKGPSWGDVILSPKGDRVFANAKNVNKVAVFDINSRSLEAVLDVGERPVHLWNPNHINEIWTHADGPGEFYVINPETLTVSDPVLAALDETGGHGKLLYSAELGTSYYATNTNNPGVFPIEGETHAVSEMITLCDAPCSDDPETEEDEALLTCGSTHDKAYNPALGYAIFQCSGATRGNYAFLDTATDTLVQDLVPIAGSITHSAGNEYILVIDAGAESNQVNIWDTKATEHNGIDFDASLTIDGEPSARGTQFRMNRGGQWEAWIPQTAGNAVAVLNLETYGVEMIEVGTLTKPEGARHFSRRAMLGGDWLFTYNDAGVVMINLETREVTQGPAITGSVSRIVFASSEEG